MSVTKVLTVPCDQVCKSMTFSESGHLSKVILFHVNRVKHYANCQGLDTNDLSEVTYKSKQKAP